MTFEQKANHQISSGKHALTGSMLNRRGLMSAAIGIGATASLSGLGLGGIALQGAVAQEDAASLPLHTWLLDSPDALRPVDPGPPAESEVDELLQLQEERNDGVMEIIQKWGSRHAVLPWLEFGMDLTASSLPPGILQERAQALLRTAMNDAIVAVLDAQSTYSRPAPFEANESIAPIEAGGDESGSFPSLNAAVAGAAASVLAYLFPEASEDEFTAMANEAAMSRLQAGAAYRSDIEAGLEIGSTVGQLAVEHGQNDGSDAVWDGSGWPTGDGYYEKTPPKFSEPFVPLAGTWTTWVLPRGDAIRPAPFHEFGSLGWEAELETVRQQTSQRSMEQERTIDYWLARGPQCVFTNYAVDLIERDALSDYEAAALLAASSVAAYDALVAIWDAKYHYWIARASTLDPSIDMYIPNPPYPSYPGGFASGCSSAAAVLGDAFPDAAVELMNAAAEGAAQRAWSGVHYVIDDDIGLLMGSQVGRMTIGAIRLGSELDT